MSSSLAEIMSNAGEFFNAFNILGTGLIIIWAVMSVFLANAISEKRDERILMMLMFMMFGGIIFFASDPGKFLLLIASICLVVYGMFKILWKRKELDK